MSLKTVKSDLFHFARPTYFAHACNCLGSWGAGIAREFRDRFPEAYDTYQKHCEDGVAPGQVLITKERIVCLFTSKGYSSKLSPPEIIIQNTEKAIRKLLDVLPKDAKVYSNKFNSGLFRVPWDRTELVLKECLKKRPDIDWVICEYE